MRIKGFFSELRLYVCNHIISKIPSHTIRLFYYRKLMNFNIGEGSTILMGCTFDACGNLAMGDYSTINSNCRIDTRGGITIGNSVSISNDVTLLTADHDMNSSTFSGREAAINIKDYVWIGTRALVLPGISIDKGAVIAASSTVTKNVQSYDVVAGTPAKFIKKRIVELNYTVKYRRLFQ